MKQPPFPAFYTQARARYTFPLSWSAGRYARFEEWKQAAHARYMASLLAPPPEADFGCEILAEEQRDGYVCRKLLLNITGDSRVTAYLLVPGGEGPFPAVLCLHDHGAFFAIGKEKVIRPFGEPAKLKLARPWVKKCYAGRWIGDELARRNHIVFSTDALNWGDRACRGKEEQALLAAALFNIGMSLAGLIAYEDLQAIRFLASLPQIAGVATLGFSFGGYRAWQAGALSPQVTVGCAISWLGCIADLASPGNAYSRSQSAYTTLHPGIYNYLDFPDLASIACPKPMLFYNGSADKLFPRQTVERAYRQLEAVWQSQGVRTRLETRLWDAGHVFTLEMQEAAFAWLSQKVPFRGQD